MASLESHPTPVSFEALLSGEYPPGTGRPDIFAGSRGRGGHAGFAARGGRRGGPIGFGYGANPDFFAGRGDVGGHSGGEDDMETEGLRAGIGGDPGAGWGFGGPGAFEGPGGFGGPGALGGPGTFGAIGFGGQGAFGAPAGFGGHGGYGGFGGFGGAGFGFGGRGGFGPRGFGGRPSFAGFPPRSFGGPYPFSNAAGSWYDAFDAHEKDIAGGPRFNRITKPVFPRVDILTSDVQYVVEIELPGVHKEDIIVRVSDDEKSITVEGSFPAPAEDQPERVYVERGRVQGRKFARTIPLPGSVDKDSVGAKYTDGVLIVKLTKVEKDEGQAVNVE